MLTQPHTKKTHEKFNEWSLVQMEINLNEMEIKLDL